MFYSVISVRLRRSQEISDRLRVKSETVARVRQESLIVAIRIRNYASGVIAEV